MENNKQELRERNRSSSETRLKISDKKMEKSIIDKNQSENKTGLGSKKLSIGDKDKKRNLIVVIRISGLVKIRKNIEETLYRLKLRRKYSCTLIKPTKDNLGMIEKVKHYVAYGEINKEVLVKLIQARAKSIKGNKKELKIDAEKAADDLISGKSSKQLGFKSFFRLHPPRKGIDSKRVYPKGVLGHNKDINKLVERML